MACQSVTSVGFTPLPDMSAVATYNGHLGRLYEDGGTPTNAVPVAHAVDMATAAGNVQKLDSAGNPAINGKIVVISTGFSNVYEEWGEFMRVVPDRNPAVILVNGAIPNRTADIWADPDSDVWATLNTRLAAKSVTRHQVQVIWLKHTLSNPTGDFATHLATLTGYYKQIVQNLASFFPNAQFMFWSSRIYGGYTTNTSPEPYAYENGYAVRDTILEQTAGTDPDLAIGAASPIVAFASGTILTGAGTIPAMAWATYMDGADWKGAYFWADGTTPNGQGTVWNQGDYEGDCVHPAGDDDGVFAPDGAEHKCAAMLKLFFENSPYTTPWWYAPILPVVVGTIQSITTTDTYTTAAAYTPPANEKQLVFVFSRAGAAPVQPVVTGHGITYNPIDRQLFGSIASPGAQVAVFEGEGIASPTNTVLTVTTPAQNQVCLIAIAVSVPTIYALSQTAKKNAVDSANSIQVNLDAQTDEIFVIAAFGDTVGAAFTEKAGWTELTDLNTGGTPLGRLALHWVAPYDDPAEGTRSGVGNMAIGAVVLAYGPPPPSYLLEVTASPTDGGTITSSPAGISYPSDPDHEFVEGTVVTLTATPVPGYIFDGWTGDFDTVVGNVATVEMDEAKQITAVFRAITPSVGGPSSGNSRIWSVHVPVGLGPFDRLLPLRCGDLENVRDSSKTLPNPLFARSLKSGQREEIARTMDEGAGQLGLTCTELAAGRLDTMRAIGCPFPLQRRTCGEIGAPTFYEHYTAVQLGERTLSNPTAAGPTKQDNIPNVAFPGVYGKRLELTDKPAHLYQLPDDLIPVGLAYCYNVLCSNCLHPCDKLYLLTQERVDEETVQLTMQASEDGGWNWDGLAIPEMQAENGFLFCHQGSRLFIGDANGVYYSDDPEAEEWYWIATLESVGIRKMVGDGETIFGINETNEIWRSTDEGLTWQQVMAEDSLTTGVIRDIAIAGNVVATVGENGGGAAEILYSRHRGDWQTWEVYSDGVLPTRCGLALANPNPFDKNRFWIYVIGRDAGSGAVEVWKSEGPADWRRLHRHTFGAILANSSQIHLDGDGYIGWFQVVAEADNSTYTLRTSDGGKTLIDVSHNASASADEMAAILAVCPFDPDTALVAATSDV